MIDFEMHKAQLEHGNRVSRIIFWLKVIGFVFLAALFAGVVAKGLGWHP